MSKTYFEMNDKERFYKHTLEFLDYAITYLAEGIGGTGEYSLSVEDVNTLQREASEHIIEAQEAIAKLYLSVKEQS